jgi:uncharacterized phiE125 gp8 family phage protein
MGGLVTTIEPTAEPILLAEAKDHCRVTHAVDDNYLTDLIAVARHHVEQVTARALVNRTLRLDLDDFPACEEIELDQPPAVSVTHLKYYDSDNVLQTFSSGSYALDASNIVPRIVLATTASWPTAYERPNAVQITYVAGYGAHGGLVPPPLRHAMKLLIGHWYENREPVVTGTIATDIPMTVTRLLQPYRVAMA